MRPTPTNVTIRFTNKIHARSCMLSLTIAFLLFQCTHAVLRGASSSSAEDDDSSPHSMPSDEPAASNACFSADGNTGASKNDVQFNNLVVFGDSYSDVGNVWEASNRTQPQWPPYYRGRYSNGRNYVDFVGEALPLGTPVSTSNVWAWGGATTNNDLVLGYSTFLNATVPSFQDQVREYLNQTADAPCDGSNSSSTAATLYVAIIGYNDYWWYANENATSGTTTRQDMQDFVDRVAGSLIGTVRDLVDRRRGGCDIDEGAVVLVGNLPPMDRLPDAQSKTDTVRQAYRALTEMHNAKLRQLLSGLGSARDGRATEVRLLPVHETMAEWADQAPCLGFVDAAAACVKSNGTVCEDPYRHLFLDDWHPMTWTHQKLARAVLTAAGVASADPPWRRRA